MVASPVLILLVSQGAVMNLLRRAFLQGDRPIRPGRDGAAMFLACIAFDCLIAAFNPRLHGLVFATLAVVYGALLALLFVAIRQDQKRRIENRRQRGNKSAPRP
jgi:hypothetical protein